MQTGRQAEAEAALDRALAFLDRESRDTDTSERNRSELPRDLEEKLRRLERQVERLVDAGKKDAAEKVLERALSELRARAKEGR